MWREDLLLFIFPQHCPVCGKRLSSAREALCLECEFKLPRTGYMNREDNPVSRLFWGRVPISMGTSLFRFEKGSAYQALLHDLKYGGNRGAGNFLGRLLGLEIRHTVYAGCDIMIPVPLHPKRLRERGYNQSAVIAAGISEITGIPVIPDFLLRSGHRGSQTILSRFERFQNVSGSFSVRPGAPDLSAKKVLLVDDVVTTGATLEACAMELFGYSHCQVFVATVCCA
jgi:ComF family protein